MTSPPMDGPQHPSPQTGLSSGQPVQRPIQRRRLRPRFSRNRSAHDPEQQTAPLLHGSPAPRQGEAPAAWVTPARWAPSSSAIAVSRRTASRRERANERRIISNRAACIRFSRSATSRAPGNREVCTGNNCPCLQHQASSVSFQGTRDLGFRFPAVWNARCVLSSA